MNGFYKLNNRDEFISFVESMRESFACAEDWEHYFGFELPIDDEGEELENLKAKPVKHGRWIWDSNAPHREHGAYKCSNCGCHSDFEENYCYNCGARMDGDSNG